MRPLYVSSLLVALAGLEAVNAQCPSGMKQLGNSCYRKTGHATKDNAIAQCDQPNEYVLDGRDIAEFNAVVDLLRVKNTSPGGTGGGPGPFFWMNAKYDQMIGKVVWWSDGAPVLDSNGDPFESDTCLALSGRGNPIDYTPWGCGEFFQAICKYDICPSPWVDKRSEGLGCYQVPNMRVSNAAAKSYCSSKGTKLAEISSQAENNAVADIIKTKLQSYTSNPDLMTWIGLFEVGTKDNWIWDISGGSGKRGGPNFTCWGNGEPHPGFNEHCVGMGRHDATSSNSDCSGGRPWGDLVCSRTEYFICEGIPTTP